LTKRELLMELKVRTWVRLGVTKHGVGVIAIRDIPKGIDPFQSCQPIARWIELSPEDIELLDPEVKRLVTDFAPFAEGVYYCPNFGFNQLDPSFYLNHDSKKPNMNAAKKGEYFVTNRDIKAGEELTVSYDTYDDTDHSFKE
jgi:SET domain